MTDLFLEILNTSFAATWVVLAVVLARLLLKKAPRSLVCGLWVLVAVRLLWPGGIEAPFSLIPSAELIPPESLFDRSPAIQSGLPIVDNIINPVYSESLRPTPGASVNPLQVWLAVFANLWLLGMIAMAAWAAISCRRVRKQVRESIPAEDGVFLCDRIDSPFIFGLFRPKIYVPSDLDADAAAHVLAHERAHLHRRDHWWKPLGFLLLTVNWFNPVLWLAYVLLCRDIEMACDERVIREFGAEEKKAYSTALLQCSTRHRHIAVCPLAFGEVGVKQRIKSVLHYKKPAFWLILVTVVLTIVLAVGLLTDPVENVSELRYNGELYVLEHQEVSFLPVQEEAIGTLRSILHNTTEHPTEELQATNLEESLAGCPLYLEENRIYLHKSDGTCIAFRRVTTDVPPTETTPSDDSLGITLRVEDVTSAGLRLIYSHHDDSEDWSRIVTSPQWFLEKWENDAWVNIMPEDTAWAEVMYGMPINGTTAETIDFERVLGSLDLGHYRIGKTFCANPEPDDTKSTTQAIVLTCWAEFDVNPLGITLSVENITPSGATLVCNQDGTLWTSIMTGSPWNLERYEDGSWVSVMPESTAWTTVAYSVPLGQVTRWNLNWSQIVGSIGPGRYRVSKTFWGERRPMFTLGLETVEVRQTVYAEFTLE